jgi:hypothetical protein
MAGSDLSQVPPSASQAPLVPTGFIQGEQGTLIAVYHPEALDHYMSAGRAGVSSLPQSHSQNGLTWPQNPQAQPSPVQTPMPASLPSQTFQGSHSQTQLGTNMNWIPGPNLFGFPQPPFRPPHPTAESFMLNRQPGQGGLRGSHVDMAGGPTHIPPSRRNQRREQQNASNGNRNNHNRTIPNRQTRMGGGNLDQIVRQPQITPPQSAPLLGDWSQWGGNR